MSHFDVLILLDIYPARELPIKGVTSSWLLQKIKHKNKMLSSKAQLVTNILKSEAQIIVMLGAGDIGKEVINVKNKLSVAY